MRVGLNFSNIFSVNFERAVADRWYDPAPLASQNRPVSSALDGPAGYGLITLGLYVEGIPRRQGKGRNEKDYRKIRDHRKTTDYPYWKFIGWTEGKEFKKYAKF